MSIKLNPYLNFNGNTKEAMEFYHGILGGELKLSTFGEYPGMPIPDGYADKIMHAQLENEDLTLMASEGQPDHPTNFGDNVSLSLSGADEAKLTDYFKQLSEGGEVMMPLEKQVWGDEFGVLKDKFGIFWMVNITKS